VFRDNVTGQQFGGVNTHTLVGAIPFRPRRTALYRQQMNAFIGQIAKLRARGIPVIGTCDCNARPGDPALNAMSRAGAR